MLNLNVFLDEDLQRPAQRVHCRSNANDQKVYWRWNLLLYLITGPLQIDFEIDAKTVEEAYEKYDGAFRCWDQASRRRCPEEQSCRAEEENCNP